MGGPGIDPDAPFREGWRVFFSPGSPAAESSGGGRRCCGDSGRPRRQTPSGSPAGGPGSPPRFCRKVSMEVIDQTAVQIDQGAVGQFHVRFAPRHFGNDISKKFNKFGIRIGEATSVPTLSFFKEFFDIFSPFDEKKRWVFELFPG